MTTRPDVSIIIPCYNAAATLLDTLASVRAQTHAGWEAVCVDDGSTDNTAALLACLANADGRIRPVCTPHAGPSAARNAGATHARADRVLLLDADDYLAPTALSELLAAARTCGEKTVLTAGHELCDGAGRSLGLMRYPSFPGRGVEIFLPGNRMPAFALLARGVLEAHPFDPALAACEDWELWLRLAQAGLRFATVPRVLFGYRLRPAGLSHQADAMYAAGDRVLGRWLPRAPDPAGVRDARHRWALACGGLALAAGAPEALERYWRTLPAFEPATGFAPAVAGSLEWAYLRAHGPDGCTWRDAGATWSTEIEHWLARGPVAPQAPAILAALRGITRSPEDHLAAAREFIRISPDRPAVLIYGLGTNGLTLLRQLQTDPALAGRELVVADDHADALAPASLSLRRVDPRRWRAWPGRTLAVVTANQDEAMCAALERAGGREGVDFITLSRCSTRAAPPVPMSHRTRLPELSGVTPA